MDVSEGVPALLGREDLVAAVRGLLADGARLVSLVGWAGAGTSSVARAALLAERTGHHTVLLADTQDQPDLLARVLGPLALHGPPTDPALLRRLSTGGEVLLVDGCPATGPVPEALAGLLGRVEGLRVVVTGREPLALPGERVVRVPPLVLPPDEVDPAALAAEPAVAIFLQAASRAFPGVHVEEDELPVVAEVCRRLDGLPGAIVQAAGRLRLMRPAVMLAEMARLGAWQFTGLAVEEDVARSLARLDEDDRDVLVALAVMHRGATPDAVAAVAGRPGSQVLDDLTRLTERQLATAHPTTGRCALTATAAALVRRQEAGSERWSRCLTRHADFFCQQARAYARRPHGSRSDPSWLLDHGNRLAALDTLRSRGEGQRALRLAVDAMTAFEHRGETDAGRRLLVEVLSETPESTSGACIQAHVWLGRLEAEHADGARTDGALHHLRTALQLARERGDLVIHLEVLNAVCENQVVLEDGVRLCEEAVAEGLALTEDPALAFGRSVFLAWHSANLHRRLRLQEAAEALGEALRIAREHGDRRLVTSFGIFHWQLPPEARPQDAGVPSMRELLEMAEAQGDVRTQGWVWMVVVGNAVDAGDRRGALSGCLRLLTLARRTSQPPLARQALVATVRLLRGQDDDGLVLRLADALAPYDEVWRAHLPPRWMADHDDVVAAARARLGRVGSEPALPDRAAAEQWQALRLAEHWLRSQAAHDEAAPEPGPPDATGLTSRERDVLAVLVQGASNKEVAVALGLRPKTVAHHCAAIYVKLGVRNRTEAVAEALRQGLALGA